MRQHAASEFAVAPSTHINAHDVSRLQAKKAAWMEEQHRLAQRAEVPRNEVYGSAAAPHGEAGEPDPSFVHKRFSLKGLKEALACLQDADKSGAALPLRWTVLTRQLQRDVAKQAEYCEEETKNTEKPPSLASSATSLPELTYIGGVDISFIPNTNDGIACLAILRYPSLELVKMYMHHCILREPYISTFLAFREIQPVCELFDNVRNELMATQTMPQLLVVDGNGVHHPRRCGLATHLGVTLDIPTIGCSKKTLQVDGITRESVEAAFLHDACSSSTNVSAPSAAFTGLPYVLPLVGASSPSSLYGYAVHRHFNSVKKCIFVSPGHCVGFAVATALIVTMLRHRIPEPVRIADLGSRAFIRDALVSVSTPAAAAAAAAAAASGTVTADL